MNHQDIIETEKNLNEAVEKSAEVTPEQQILGAEMLENPPDGSFIMGLSVFIAWVNSMLAKKD